MEQRLLILHRCDPHLLSSFRWNITKMKTNKSISTWLSLNRLLPINVKYMTHNKLKFRVNLFSRSVRIRVEGLEPLRSMNVSD